MLQCVRVRTENGADGVPSGKLFIEGGIAASVLHVHIQLYQAPHLQLTQPPGQSRPGPGLILLVNAVLSTRMMRQHRPGVHRSQQAE